MAVNPEIRLPAIDQSAEVAGVAPAQIHVRVRQRKRVRRMMRHDDGRRRAGRRKLGV